MAIGSLIGRVSSFPFYPVLLPAAFVLVVYANGVADGTQTVRPIVAGAVLTILGQAVISIGLRDLDRAAAATATLLVIAGFGLSPLLLGLLVVVARAWLRARRARLARTPLPPLNWPSATRRLNILATMFLGVVLVNGAAVGSIGLPRIDVRFPPRPAAADAPDIYVILLDSYARADELSMKFGVDNEPFLNALRDRDFEVSTSSRSNYSRTVLTLVSMLHMRLIADIPELADHPAERTAQERALSYDLGGELPALESLRDLGYESIAIAPPLGEVGLRAADKLFTAGVDEFVLQLVSKTAAGTVVNRLAPDLWYKAYRSHAIGTLEQLSLIAGHVRSRPRFVLAHILLPHAPFLFGPDGEHRAAPRCFPDCSIFDPPGPLPADMTGYWDQLQYTNRLVLDAIDDILALSPNPPVIVLMSDHGSRLFDQREAIHNLWAALTPGKPGLFPDAATPVNLFPRLLNAYFSERIPLADNRSYFSYGAGLWPMEEIPPSR